MIDLFTIPHEIEIIKINDFDVSKKTDTLMVFKERIIKHESQYPDIKKWLNNKVLPGINNHERTAWIATCNGKAVASAVVKHGEKSKFCHLHIDSDSRNKNLGDIFFSMMAMEIKRSSRDVYFSLPESLWEEKKCFFQSFGFNNASKFETQYRSSDAELTCGISFETLWENVRLKLPELMKQFTSHPDNPLCGILISVHPDYAKKIMNGEKKIEIRKKFNKKWKGHTATIYSTSPHKEILGYVTIGNVEENSPENIWENYGDKLGCSKSDFESYVGTDQTLFAITLNNIQPFPNPITLSWLNSWLKEDLRPPQSYSSFEKNENWANAMSIAQLLHNRFSSFVQVL